MDGILHGSRMELGSELRKDILVGLLDPRNDRLRESLKSDTARIDDFTDHVSYAGCDSADDRFVGVETALAGETGRALEVGYNRCRRLRLVFFLRASERKSNYQQTEHDDHCCDCV